MYQKILIPTDGSPASSVAARAGVDFARQFSAEIFGIFVAPEYQVPVYAEAIPPDYPTEEEHKATMRKAGELYLGEIQEAAWAAGLTFLGMTVSSDSPAHEIVRAAEELRCELIFMGSHGRSGLERLMLGSVSSKVIQTSKIPVLIYRAKQGTDNQTGKQ